MAEELITLCKRTIVHYRAFESQCEQAGVAEPPDQAPELYAIADQVEQIARCTPKTVEEVRFFAAAAYALSIKEPDGTPEGKDNLATRLVPGITDPRNTA